MKITPSPTSRRFDRRLTTATGEELTEAYIVGALLASGSFANRPTVEAEIEALFGLLEQVFDKLKEKRAA
jgi:hypothetical protein